MASHLGRWAAGTVAIVPGPLDPRASPSVEQELRRTLDETVLRFEELLDDAHGFVEQVAHDLRAPLAAMSGFAELVAKDESLPVVSQQLLRRIVVSAQNAADRVESVLQQARARAGELRQDVDLTECVEWVCSLLDPGVRVEPRGPLPVVHVDRQAVSQALLDVVLDAARRADGGPVTVSLTACRVPDEPLWQVVLDERGPDPVDPAEPALVRAGRLIEHQGGSFETGPGSVHLTLPVARAS